MSEPHNIALIGMMGAGKTTVGKLLAKQLGREFLDSDSVIEDHTGKSVAQIFKDYGEHAFRDWEEEAVTEALKDPTPKVLGVAGGAMMREPTRNALKEHATLIWLRAPIAALVDRVTQRRSERPMIADNPGEAMRNLYAEREPIYAANADIIIDVGEVSPETAADQIIEALK
jgi:shikimate kinase